MRLEYFQLVDRVESVDPADCTIRAIARVPNQSTVFEGHFPGYPILPGVLLIESMAQTSGHLILVLEKFLRMPFLAQIENAKLRQFVAPGTELCVTGQLVHLGSGYAVTKGRVEADGRLVAEAGIRFRTMPFPSEAMRDMMLDHARKLGLDAPIRV
jgi:3-hydroxyacyl-[acyl-carrier-protein] dehydratase